MKKDNENERLASYLASLGDDFPQLSFALNNPGAPGTVYTGADPTANAGLQFQITTSTSTDITLAPGAPVPVDQAPKVSYSLLYLDLTHFNLSDAEFTNIVVSTDGGWASLPDLASRTICLAPSKPIPIAAGAQGVSVGITGFAVANPPVGSTVELNVIYYNVDGITIDNSPSITPLGVALLPPPDQHDNNLHDDISLTVEPALVVCSKDPYPPVPNTLTIQFSPGPEGRAVIAGKETVFEVHFLYAETPGSGALCTAAQGANFIPARRTNAQQWDPPAVIGTQEPYVSLKPSSGAAIVGTEVEAVVTFDIGNIVTNLQPGATLMLVTYSGIPKYQDGSFQFVLTKMPHVDITSLEVTPNPAELEKEDGVDVVIDWVTHDAGALRLTSSDGLDQDVTGTLSFPTTIKQTTDFTLHADGIWGANLDNTATRSKTAVVTPHIEFSATILPSAGGIQLAWNVSGAESVEIDNVPGIQKLAGSIILPGPTPAPYSFTLRAFVGGNEAGAATLKRVWTVGNSVPVGGDAMFGNFSTGIAVSPDGKQLWAAAVDSRFGSISVFDSATLALLASSLLEGIPSVVAFAFTPDFSEVYVVNEIALIVLDAKSHATSASIHLSTLQSGFFRDPSAIEANDKYIFVKARSGPVSLMVLDAQTYEIVWLDPAPDNPPFVLSTGLALTGTRLHYTGDSVITTLDCQTLAVLNTANVAIPNPGQDQLVAAQDDSRTFLGQRNNWARTFPGSDWLNPAILPSPDSPNGCQGMAVTSDCMQVFVLCSSDFANSYVQMEEFDPGFGKYVRSAGFLKGAGITFNIAMMPDNTRVFIGLAGAGQGNNAFITVLVASYERSDSERIQARR
jgi:hypothetical protein